MMPEFPPILESIYFYWQIFLFSAALILNTAAIIVLLRSAGTCLRDPSVTPLFFILGVNLLQLLLVKLFELHTQSHGQFLFSERLCRIIRKNAEILSDIPFPTIGLQLASIIQGIKKDRYRYYTWFSLCFGRLTIISLPVLLAVVVNTVNRTNVIIDIEKCREENPSTLMITIRHSLVLGLPLIFILFMLFTLVPNICRRGRQKSSSLVDISMDSLDTGTHGRFLRDEGELDHSKDCPTGSQLIGRYSNAGSQLIGRERAASHQLIGRDKSTSNQLIAREKYTSNQLIGQQNGAGSQLIGRYSGVGSQLIGHDAGETQMTGGRSQLVSTEQLTRNFSLKSVVHEEEEERRRRRGGICNLDKPVGRDLTLLSVLVVSIALCRTPKLILQYNKFLMIHEASGVLVLMETLLWELPLLLIPLAVITIRHQSSGVSLCSSNTQNSDSFENVVFRIASPSRRGEKVESNGDSLGENMNLIVSIEGKDLENAIFKSKTTTL